MGKHHRHPKRHHRLNLSPTDRFPEQLHRHRITHHRRYRGLEDRFLALLLVHRLTHHHPNRYPTDLFHQVLLEYQKPHHYHHQGQRYCLYHHRRCLKILMRLAGSHHHHPKPHLHRCQDLKDLFLGCLPLRHLIRHHHYRHPTDPYHY